MPFSSLSFSPPSITNPDRIILRLLLSAGIVVSALFDDAPVWRLAIGWVAAAILIVAVWYFGVLQPAARRNAGLTPWIGSVTAAVSATVGGLAFTSGSTTWIAFLGVVAAGAAPLPPTRIAMLTVPPTAAIVVHSWHLGHNAWTLAINVLAAVVIVGYMQARRHQRETAELAAAQREVIDTERARALAAERQREVAAQLHDVLAHTLSGLIITLQGAALAARVEGVSDDLTQRLHAATELAKDGLTEARSAVGSLRSGADTVRAAPAVPLADWLDRTLERLRSTTDVEVTVTGSLDDIPPSWTEIVRSVLMEGLTNSLRHAVGAPIRIDATSREVRVISVGDVDTFVDRGHHSGGHGLTGLQERVAAAGGSLTCGPTDRGFELTARIVA